MWSADLVWEAGEVFEDEGVAHVGAMLCEESCWMICG